MKRLILNIIVILAVSVFYVSICFAVGNASTYKITVQSIQLKNTNGSWVTIGQPNREIDIASVSTGSVASALLSDVPIPVGSYVNFKLVISETMKFSGSDGANLSKSGGSVTVTGTDTDAASTATWAGFPPNATLTESVESYTITASQQGEVTAVLDLDASDTDSYIEVYGKTDLSAANAVSVNSQSVVTMSFDFDTQSTVIYQNVAGNDIMFFTPPQSGTQFSITADGSSLTITESQMRVDF